MARFNVFSIIQAPLILGERVLGIINAVNPNRPGGFTDRDVNLLQQIATIVATTMENRRLFEQATKRANREFLINTINQKIQGATSVERALEIATREIGQQLKARKVTVEIGATSGNGHSAKQPEIN
jgi:GAF domain-containing protein